MKEDGKLNQPLTPISSRLVDARLELVNKVWGDSPKLYNHAVLCSVGLPYRNLGDDVRTFQRTSGKTSLRMEAGAVPSRDGFTDIGLPYGPRARLLLLHLCSEAVKRQSPVVEVDDSFTAFARSLGLATSGRNLKTLREQILRMSVVSMRLSKSYGEYVDVFQGPIFSKLRAETPSDPNQMALWASFVEFSPDFFESLTTNAVPLRKEAIGALKHSSRALDIYAWLSHRLWRINNSSPVTLKWTTIRFQFGEREQDIKSFKRAFKTALKQVLMVYPEANVSIIRGGLQLKRSAPPVAAAKPNRLLVG
tara:strand:+ start:297 stop:1217 length:921 start_codon:yes stop_codon:yes gene_type:complete